jgi:hypothetical protein
MLLLLLSITFIESDNALAPASPSLTATHERRGGDTAGVFFSSLSYTGPKEKLKTTT